MPDWLTHVLVGYALATACSLYWDWITPRLVTLAMVGALLPDLTKWKLLVPSEAVGAALGVPWNWSAFHTLGGTAVAVLAVVVLLPARYRRRGALVLALGAASHHALDLLLVQPSGHTYPALWPLSTYRAPAADLYLSSDRGPAVVAAVAALVVWYARYHADRLAARSPTRNESL